LVVQIAWKVPSQNPQSGQTSMHAGRRVTIDDILEPGWAILNLLRRRWRCHRLWGLFMRINKSFWGASGWAQHPVFIFTIAMLAMLALVGTCLPLCAQDSDADDVSNPVGHKPLKLGNITVSGELRGRGQGWNWFLGDMRTRYAFGNTLL